MPAKPPAVNLDHPVSILVSPCPSRLARPLFAASYDPNLIADSGMILITFRPLPDGPRQYSVLMHHPGGVMGKFLTRKEPS